MEFTDAHGEQVSLLCPVVAPRATLDGDRVDGLSEMTGRRAQVRISDDAKARRGNVHRRLNSSAQRPSGLARKTDGEAVPG